MRWRIALILMGLALLGAGVSPSHNDIETTFVENVDFYNLNLDKEQRQALIDAFKRGDSLSARLGQTRIVGLNEGRQWLRLKTSDQGAIEIKNLMAENGTTTTLLIFTACAPSCNSNVYATNYASKEQPTLKVVKCDVSDFLDRESPDYAIATSLIDLPLIEWTFLNGSDTLRAHLSALEELDEETLRRVKKALSNGDLYYVFDSQKNTFHTIDKP